MRSTRSLKKNPMLIVSKMESKQYAQLSKVMYLPQTEREEAASKLGYTLQSQDEDRALFVNDQNQAVIGFRGTDLKDNQRAWRDVLTDTAVLFGKGQQTPRLIANERFLQDALASKQYDSVSLTGHSLGGLGAVALGRDYGLQTHAYSPAFGIPEVARSVKDRIIERRKHPNLNLYTTWLDPISKGVMYSLTGKVHAQKRKHGLSSHTIENYV